MYFKRVLTSALMAWAAARSLHAMGLNSANHTDLADAEAAPQGSFKLNAIIVPAPVGYQDSDDWTSASVLHLTNLIRESEIAEVVSDVLQDSENESKLGLRQKKQKLSWDEDVLINVTNYKEARIPSPTISIKRLRYLLKKRAQDKRATKAVTSTIPWRPMGVTKGKPKSKPGSGGTAGGSDGGAMVNPEAGENQVGGATEAAGGTDQAPGETHETAEGVDQAAEETDHAAGDTGTKGGPDEAAGETDQTPGGADDPGAGSDQVLEGSDQAAEETGEAAKGSSQAAEGTDDGAAGARNGAAVAV